VPTRVVLFAPPFDKGSDRTSARIRDADSFVGDCEILKSAIPRLRPAESRTNASRDMTRPLNLVRIYAYMEIALSVLA
jgi:hypothetical protein